MSNERLNLPSASSRARDSRCPGALNLIRSLQEQGLLVERTHAWTESGTCIHAAVEGEEVDLEHDEETARETVVARLASLREHLTVPLDADELIEERLWLRGGLKRIASGKPDRIWRYGATSVIPDIKTGWGVTEAEETNLQFRAYAVLEWLNRADVEEVIVATINAHGAKPKPVVYDVEALQMAEQEWRDEITACNQPDAPRVAGPIQCKYCPAKLHCDKAREVIPQVAALTIHEPGMIVTNEQIAELLDRCGHAEKMIGEIKAEAKRRLTEDPASVPGWQIVPGKVTKPVTDLTTVFNRCIGKGVTAEQFTAACSLTKTNLTDALKTAMGIKGKALNAIIDEVLAGATAEKQSAPSLKRI